MVAFKLGSHSSLLLLMVVTVVVVVLLLTSTRRLFFVDLLVLIMGRSRPPLAGCGATCHASSSYRSCAKLVSLLQLL